MSPRPRLTMPDTVSKDDVDDELDVDERQDHGGGRAPGGVLTALTGADVSTTLTVNHIPAPYDAGDSRPAVLDDQERSTLDVCEQALTGLRRAFVVAGKALEVINRGRLYRETHATFADYVSDRWEMKRSHAYRLIEEWPVAAAVSPIGDINEAQTRELLPVYKAHGQAATMVLYREARELAGGRVTAAALAEARDALPVVRRMEDPDLMREFLHRAVADGRVPLLAPPVQVPQQTAGADQVDDDEGEDIGQAVVDEGAEAIATMEAALAQQRQIYDALGGAVLSAALLYDPGRGEHLRMQLRQYATRTAYRMRDVNGDEE